MLCKPEVYPVSTVACVLNFWRILHSTLVINSAGYRRLAVSLRRFSARYTLMCALLRLETTAQPSYTGTRLSIFSVRNALSQPQNGAAAAMRQVKRESTTTIQDIRISAAPSQRTTLFYALSSSTSGTPSRCVACWLPNKRTPAWNETSRPDFTE